MDATPSTGSLYDILVYLLFMLGAVFVGPLEAVLGLALYWLVGNQGQARSES
jgi:hypothetical protein